MSMWEFIMTMEGWKLANGGGEGEAEAKPPTEDEFDAVMAQWSAENPGHG
ncbi:hypothetical protein [Sphingomonas sp. LK11]|jgi:hypothetical protein|nr:hypothetical protein [Sphingomonas sp. LK11]